MRKEYGEKETYGGKEVVEKLDEQADVIETEDVELAGVRECNAIDEIEDQYG